MWLNDSPQSLLEQGYEAAYVGKAMETRQPDQGVLRQPQDTYRGRMEITSDVVEVAL